MNPANLASQTTACAPACELLAGGLGRSVVAGILWLPGSEGQQYSSSQYSRLQKSTSGGRGPGERVGAATQRTQTQSQSVELTVEHRSVPVPLSITHCANCYRGTLIFLSKILTDWTFMAMMPTGHHHTKILISRNTSDSQSFNEKACPTPPSLRCMLFEVGRGYLSGKTHLRSR